MKSVVWQPFKSIIYNEIIKPISTNLNPFFFIKKIKGFFVSNLYIFTNILRKIKNLNFFYYIRILLIGVNKCILIFEPLLKLILNYKPKLFFFLKSKLVKIRFKAYFLLRKLHLYVPRYIQRKRVFRLIFLGFFIYHVIIRFINFIQRKWNTKKTKDDTI